MRGIGGWGEDRWRFNLSCFNPPRRFEAPIYPRLEETEEIREETYVIQQANSLNKTILKLLYNS